MPYVPLCEEMECLLAGNKSEDTTKSLLQSFLNAMRIRTLLARQDEIKCARNDRNITHR